VTSSPGKLILIGPGEQKQEFVLTSGSATLGRAQINEICLDDSMVSRMHARFECKDATCTVRDLKSSNGTFVNGVGVEAAALGHGDVILVGATMLRFERTAPRSDPDPELTMVATAADMEAALAEEPLAITLSNTDEPSVAVHVRGRTWEVPLTGDALRIGRASNNDVVLTTAVASRHHAVIERCGDLFQIRDLGSSNGTWLGAKRIEKGPLRNGDTVRIGSARLVFKSGFENEQLTQFDLPSPFRTLERRPVVIVPGVMGSELWCGSEKIWPNLKLLFTEPELLRLDTPHVEARSILQEVVVVPNVIKLAQYSRLTDYLEEGLGYERGRNLLEFFFDWRQDNRVSARRLAQVIEDWQHRSHEAARPLTIIAHSMGCLVSRYYVERLGGKNKVERLILLGGPHYGSPRIVSNLLLGPEMLPFGLLNESLRRVLVGLPYAYQLIPTYACATDRDGNKLNLLQDHEWMAESSRPLLRSARAFHSELGAKSSVPSVSIFGYGLKTITNLKVLRDGSNRWIKIDADCEPHGDTAVPESSAVLKGGDIHPVEQHHGSLYTDNDVRMRLKIELTRGLGRPT
jgi:pSer/pThr/pTyr-binding forkhead associated (FHA) protein/pimeloyl-ACP methyl ester carboxylesterase